MERQIISGGTGGMGESDVRQQDSRARRAVAPLPDLVVSKVRSPLLRPGTVRRCSLIARLAQGDRRPVISVVAPPGYGKTTLLAQ